MLSRRGFLAVASALGVSAATPLAMAKSRRHQVIWTTIRFHDDADQKRHEPSLRKFLEKEGRHANWGKRGEPVEASVEVRELSSGISGDVCKVACAAVGRIPGIGVVKSKFSYGGKPAEREKLERHVLELVARGVVTRLAEMARARDGAWHVEKALPRGIGTSDHSSRPASWRSAPQPFSRVVGLAPPGRSDYFPTTVVAACDAA